MERATAITPDLYAAAVLGSTERLTQALQSSSLIAVTEEGNTVLHIAAGLGHDELVAFVAGKHPSLLVSENSRSDTPLHCAATAGHHRMVSLLIQLDRESGHGNMREHEMMAKKNREGDTALHEAARNGHHLVAGVLVLASPTLSLEVNKLNISPLYLAVVSRSVGVVRALVESMHAVSFAGPKGQTALHAAVLQSQELTHMILKKKPMLAKEGDASKSTPLHYAASGGDLKIVKIILDFDPLTIYSKDDEGLSAMHIAAHMGHVKIIDLLIATRPDSMELLNNKGRNFLHVAIARKRSKVVHYVLGDPRFIKLVNQQDYQGNTPLHLAVISEDPKIVNQLLKGKKTKINSMNNEGFTPLDLTVRLSTFYPMATILLALTRVGSQFSPIRQDHLEPWDGEKEKGAISPDTPSSEVWPVKASKNLVIIAVLLWTIAFSAGFNILSKYNADGNWSLQFQMFMIILTISVVSSIFATVLLVLANMSHHIATAWENFIVAAYFVWIALSSLSIAFTAFASVRIGRTALTLIALACGLVFPYYLSAFVLYSLVTAALPTPLIGLDIIGPICRSIIFVLMMSFEEWRISIQSIWLRNRKSAELKVKSDLPIIAECGQEYCRESTTDKCWHTWRRIKEQHKAVVRYYEVMFWFYLVISVVLVIVEIVIFVVA